MNAINKSEIQRMTPRFYATSWAFPYLKDYPRTAKDTFDIKRCDSNVNLASIDEIINECKSNIKDLLDSGDVKNWNYESLDIFSDTEVWFVTSEEIGSDVPVYNRFTGKDEIVKVPSVPSNIIEITKKEECPSVDRGYSEELCKEPICSEENPVNEKKEVKKYIMLTNPDLLGVYLPKTGTIFIFIDRIDEFRDKQFVFQIVLLHEFIHAALDLVPDAKRNYGTMGYKWSTKINNKLINEESLDNALVLIAYDNDPEVVKFIKSQPEVYRNALEIRDEKTLKDFIISLIKYKLDGENDNISSLGSNKNKVLSNQNNASGYQPPLTSVQTSTSKKSNATGKSESYSITANGVTHTGVIRSRVIEHVVDALINGNPNITDQDLRNIFGTSVIKLPGEKIPKNSKKCQLPNGNIIVLNLNVWYEGDVKKKIIDKLKANKIYNISIY